MCQASLPYPTLWTRVRPFNDIRGGLGWQIQQFRKKIMFNTREILLTIMSCRVPIIDNRHFFDTNIYLFIYLRKQGPAVSNEFSKISTIEE
jgi:hypothetical protein